MDCSQQILGAARSICQAWANDVRSYGAECAEGYNKAARLYREAARLAGIPSAHAVPNRDRHEACRGLGCTQCQFLGRGVVTPHPIATCDTCKWARLTESITTSVVFPTDGPWREGYVAPAVQAGTDGFGRWVPGTVVRHARRTQVSNVVLIVADVGMQYLYRTAINIDATRWQWGGTGNAIVPTVDYVKFDVPEGVAIPNLDESERMYYDGR